ncbi:capsule biosynthesis protein [Campylobacter iguaniorum]|uniref:capsule biosynthesis protein n=1 Tax=Campylobacter iguaniorum TaxID=1244531 RepID=UPI001F3FEEEE|nr:capsular biosynthesis protein [Campylobacter iguaniorum]
MGKFFNKLFTIFAQNGAKVYRIGFNAGDSFFAKDQNYYPYKGKPKHWRDFIEDFLISRNIDMIFLFGDCRFYHKHAISIAKNTGIDVYVFEEGYLRPGFITMEYFGVNSNSSMPKHREFYDNYTSRTLETFASQHTHSTYTRMAWWAFEYYVISDIFYFLYPHYIHHRNFTAFDEGINGIKNFFRKYINMLKERNLEYMFENKITDKYYFVAIQTHDDFQVRTHSKFRTIEDFLQYVLLSFIKFAPKDTSIVFKHHPMDRGKKNYKPFIDRIAKEYDVEDRIIVVWDVHLPTILRNAKAVVVINSTVGLSALYHAKPTICLGKSMYDIDGLTSKGMSLDKFWTHHKPVDRDLYHKFRQYLLDKTQIPGSFYLGGDKITFE